VPVSRRRKLIELYRESGLTMAEFVRREGINYSTFAGWVAKTGKAAADGAIKFAQLSVPAMSPGKASHDLEVRLVDGTVLRAGRVADLVALVRGLRS
jgi:hypothetical protein